jgi:hypothetical protein
MLKLRRCERLRVYEPDCSRGIGYLARLKLSAEAALGHVFHDYGMPTECIPKAKIGLIVYE